MNQKIRDREVEKSYLCIILGAITPPAGRLEGYLLKDEAKKLVSVRTKPRPRRASTAVTLYQTLAAEKRPVPGGLRAWSPAAPTRSGPSSPPPAIPCWGTGSMAGPGRTRSTAAPGARPSAPTSWPSASPPTPAVWSRPQRPGVDRGPGGFRDRLLPPRPPAPVTGEAFSRRKILFLDRGIFFC